MNQKLRHFFYTLKYQITQQDILQAGNLELLAKQVVEGFITGLHKSPYHGFSVEFAEHRQYNNGESTRNIDWKLFARTDKLFVKRFEEETNLRCQLVIDNSASMYFPADGISKIRFSAIAAASIANLLRKQRDASGLTLISNEISYNQPPKISLVSQKQLLNSLQNCLNSTPSQVSGNLPKNLHLLAETLHKRSLVIIFSDFFGSDLTELFEALQHLKYNKHDIVLFNVTDKYIENEFELNNRPYLLIDSETNEQIKIHPNAVKEDYLNNLNEFKLEIKLTSAKYKIDYFDAIVGTDFNQVLLPFYLKRGKLN